MKKQQGNAIVSLLYVIVFAIFAVAYAANIYKLAIAFNEPATMMLINRQLGIVLFPWGIFLGFF